MATRPVDLIVMKDAGCPLLKQGDRVIINGLEVRPQNGARLCLKGLCTLYPQVQAYLKGTPASKPLLSKQMYCTADGCQSVFEAVESRGESKTKNAPTPVYADVAVAVASAPMPGLAQTLPAGFNTPPQLAGETGTVIMHAQKGQPFMQRVPPNVQVQLTLASKKMPFADGEIILRDGVMGEALYVVADGEVEVVRQLPDNTEQRIAILGIGECFGEMSLITQQPTTARVRARRGAVVFNISKHDVQKVMRTSPELQTIFTQMLADRIRAINTIPQQGTTGTVPAANSGISGKLSLISMIDLVQTLRSSRRSGTLTLKANNQEGVVTFKDGQVFAAMVGKKMGEDAFFVTVGWAEADFHFQLMIADMPPNSQIKMETMSLLMEALRRMDESKRK